MQFLDKESEEILKLCVDNESTYPEILTEQFKQNLYPNDKLRGIIKYLIDEGYLSKIIWGDGVPYRGRIEQKGRIYFKNKEIYIRKALRENGDFNLDAESENVLRRLCDMYYAAGEPYVLITETTCSAQTLKILSQKGLIELGTKGISFNLSGSFVCTYMITQRGKQYFADKEAFIEEVLAFPMELPRTVLAGDQYNISSGNNSPVIVGNTGTISMEYSFEQAQEAIDEILNRLDELVVSSQRKEEILETLTEAGKLVKEKKKHPLKIMLKGVYDILKDVGCSVLSSLLISKFGL